VVCVGMMRLLKVEEAEFVWNMVKKRFSKKPDDDNPPAPIDVTPSGTDQSLP
jgi:hypothetical protein